MPSKSKKQFKTSSRLSSSDSEPLASPRTPSVSSLDSEVSEEDLRSCKIWLSETSMVASYLAPGSLVSVSLAALKNEHSNGFPLSLVTDECG
ncbi:hypothetical protein REPUB_Repub07fG0238100 [Reevesia pubescens]